MLAAIPKLLKVQRQNGAAIMLGCRGRPHAMPEQARDVPDLDWSTCPLCLAHAVLQPLHDLAALAKISPLVGWPDRYSLWVLRGMTTMQGA